MSTTAVHSEILKLSSSRPGWQRDALRRIFTSGTLTSTDLEEVLQICMTEYNLTAGSASVVPIFFSVNHTSASKSDGAQVCLEKITEVANVNALANGQTLSFLSKGLTVVYGDNGSGKSGYARVVRRCVTSRGKKQQILPNCFDTNEGPPTARIFYKLGQDLREFTWNSLVDAPLEDLKRVSFFDSDSAGVYVDEKNSPAFAPFGLDVLPALVDVCGYIQQELKRHKILFESKRQSAIHKFDTTRETPVVKKLAVLCHNSDVTDFLALSTLSDADLRRIAELKALLAADIPSALKNVERIEDVLKKVKSKIRTVSQNLSSNYLSETHASYMVAKAASEVASEDFSRETLFPIGGLEWKMLWESAKRYSESVCYPEESYPSMGNEVACVLCFQPLDEAAQARLIGFEAFVKKDIQTILADAKRKHDDARRTLTDLHLCLRTRGEVVSDLALIDTKLAQSVRIFYVKAQLVRRDLLRKGASNYSLQPVSELDEAFLKLTNQKAQFAERLTEADKFAKELFELEDRALLSTLIDVVHAEIEHLKEVTKFDAALNSANTSAVTRKGAELTDKYVNELVRSQFLSELKEIGLQRIPIKLVPAAGSAGTKLWQIKFEGLADERGAKFNVSSILSQGEQRGISLAAFFAELDMEDSNSALVFDDPVSSLDHSTRRYIAKRLVREAASRQVIVFTHDNVFMLLLEEFADADKIDVQLQQIRRISKHSGICSNDIPWQAKSVGKRIGQLKQEIIRIEKVSRDEPQLYEKEVEYFYVKLRETWERGVEEILLNGTVTRFDRAVQTNRLKLVADICPADIDAVTNAMTRCSNFAHDEASVIQSSPPEIHELKEDVAAIKAWAESIKKRRK